MIHSMVKCCFNILCTCIDKQINKAMSLICSFENGDMPLLFKSAKIVTFRRIIKSRRLPTPVTKSSCNLKAINELFLAQLNQLYYCCSCVKLIMIPFWLDGTYYVAHPNLFSQMILPNKYSL